MQHSAEVVIIGGGIQGLSLAYHLAIRGVSDVLLLEMNTLGSGSSGRSAAVFGYAFPSENCLPLFQLCFEAFMRFPEEMEADPGYEPIGCLLMGGAQGAPELRQRAALLEKMGTGNRLIEPGEIDRLTPGLNLEEIEVGLYNPRE
ncbi:MAG: FAD-dependent oxidoreductase, partial [Anaerolineae bacterium]